jgi:ABC-type transporter Mla subunit MlaD
MPQARRSTTTTTRRPRALNRLEKSIDAAESALKDLRDELGRGGRDLAKDLEKTLRDSRKNLRSLSRTVAKDIQKLQKAATSKRPAAARGRRAGARQTKTKRTRSSSAKR